MFEPQPKARADLKPGTLYAVAGEGGWIYYGQISPKKDVGFFRKRDRKLASIDEVLAAPIMSRVGVGYYSIGRAVRSGKWKKLGRFAPVADVCAPRSAVQWPWRSLDVTVWIDGVASYETRVDDPAIQDMEIIAAWDAEDHIPARLTADFGAEKAEWHVGGPIRRERRVKEEYAKRFPNQPWHSLPHDWVPTNVRSWSPSAIVTRPPSVRFPRPS